MRRKGFSNIYIYLKEEIAMKVRKWLFVVIAAVFLIPLQAHAHYLYLSPSTDVTADVGSTVSVDVYLHATGDDELQMWSMTIGSDTTELTYSSITYGTTVLWTELFASASYDSETGLITDIQAACLPSQTTYDVLAADSDFLLFTIFFTFDGGTLDSQDVWITWTTGMDGFGFTTAGWVDTLDQVGTGPDYASSVPLPGALWLLGSGLVGLLGMRRRKA